MVRDVGWFKISLYFVVDSSWKQWKTYRRNFKAMLCITANFVFELEVMVRKALEKVADCGSRGRCA